MRVTLNEVSKGRRGQSLPEISLEFATGEARIVPAETEQRPTVLGLLAAGRMKPDAGTVTIDGRADAAALRRRVALVDTPDVCDPAPNVAVSGLVAEELMFAGRPSHPVAVMRWLTQAGMRDLARVPIADVSPRERVRLLLELTALREGVEAMVLVSPQRHGGRPEEWWEVAEDFADRGFGVLVITGVASAAQLAGRALRADPVPAADDEEPRAEASPVKDEPAGEAEEVPEPEAPAEPEPGEDADPEPGEEADPAPGDDPVPEPAEPGPDGDPQIEGEEAK